MHLASVFSWALMKLRPALAMAFWHVRLTSVAGEPIAPGARSGHVTA
jgi:hypothetical protein